jgi:hypothetical protein
MIRTKIVGTHNNGDIEYKVLKDIDYFIKGLSWCIAFLLACLFCFFIQKWVVLPFLNILSYIFLLCTVVLFGYLYRRSSRLEKEEASLVTDAIHFIAEQDAIQRNLEIVDTKFCSDTLDSHGTIDEEYVLVLLSDKTIIKYPIEHLSKEDKRYNYKLIKKDFLEDINKTQTQKISRTTLQYRIMNSPALITLITWIIIIGILAIGAVVMSLFLLNIHDAYDAIALFSIPFWLLLFVPIYSYIDKKLPKNRVCNVIRFILSIPVFILKLSKLTTPFLTIMATFMLIFVYSFLPVFIIVMGIELLGYDTTFNTKLFVFLTFPFIIASQGSIFIRNIILRQAPFRGNDHHYQLFMRELVKFLYTKENLNFIIYTGYFFFLTVSTLKTLQTGGTVLSQEIDLIVAKSFLVYIACTSMFDRKKSSNIEGGMLLTLLIKMLLACDDEVWRKTRKSHQLND